MRLYLSGGMTGYPDFNFPAFREAAAALRRAGYSVIDPSEFGVWPDMVWADYLKRDLADMLQNSDAVAVLDLEHIRTSRGCDLEVYVARALDMRVESVDWWLNEKGRPWL